LLFEIQILIIFEIRFTKFQALPMIRIK
jgi:hypothetical protein